MDLVTLNKQIAKNQLSNFYIFTGEEISMQHLYIKQINTNYTRIDTIAEVWNRITTKLKLCMTGKNELYVVRDDTDFMNNEKAYTDIHRKIKNGTIILCVTNIDKRSKFYKYFKDEIVEFNHMTTKQLLPTVRKLIGGRDNILSYFIEHCNNDYSTIYNNIDKLKRLGNNELTKQLCDSTCNVVDTYTVFDLTDSLITLNQGNTINILNTLLTQGENELNILTNIYLKLRQCILVEGYRGSQSIGKDTGLNPYVCKLILENNRIKPGNLLYSLRLVNKYMTMMKGGQIDMKTGAYMCVIEIITL